MIKFFQLIFEFFKTGLLAVGGGLATIPFLSEMGVKYNWFTIDTLSTMIAVSESTPGPMGVNMATYVGHTVGGMLGALLATLSLVAPSILVICIIAKYFQKFKNSKLVKQCFAGLKPAVVAFIAAACLSLFQTTFFNQSFQFNWKCFILLLGMLFLDKKYPKIHPITYIVSAACIGIIFQL